MTDATFHVTGNVVDPLAGEIFPAAVRISSGRIAAVDRLPGGDGGSTFLMPGFIDAHIHVESSMLTPWAFARAAVAHGTVAAVSDPHEIANVLGVEGVRFMLENAADSPLRFCFGAPSCVPATAFESAGGSLDDQQVAALLDRPDIGYLAEMMNYPGVLAGDRQVLAKIAAARRRGKPVDGHAPGLRGQRASDYLAAGISTDHECVTLAEAHDKLAASAKILIREGSAARNFDALHPLLQSHPDRCMFCSDDKHPDELATGHIQVLARRAVAAGHDVMNVLRAACVNPVEHYRLGTGLLRVGDRADFIEVSDLRSFGVLRTFLGGKMAAQHGRCLLPVNGSAKPNRFRAEPIRADELRVPTEAGTRLHVIEALDGQLVTRRVVTDRKVSDGCVVADPARDLLKITVVNRYAPAKPAVAFALGFGLRRGAIASSVAHDSHNVIAVGTDDAALAEAVNLVIAAGGGLSLSAPGSQALLPLPIAGLMSDAQCPDVARMYSTLDAQAKALGSKLRAPYMTLSFMALLVIPEIKLSDKGLFDAGRFEFLPVQI